MNKALFALGIATLLLVAGCVIPRPPTSGQIISTGVPTLVHLNETKTLDDNSASIFLESFSYNTCTGTGPLGGQTCTEMIPSAVFVVKKADGTQTRIGGGENQTIELQLVPFSLKVVQIPNQIDGVKPESITILVQRVSQTSPNVWMQIAPKQCGTNAWEVWMGEVYQRALEEKRFIARGTEQQILTAWLSTTQQVTIFGFAQKPQDPDTTVCAACECGRGDQLAVRVKAADLPKLSALGWTKLGNAGAIACTLDAKICPDGTAVGRTEPFCQFACPPVNLADANIAITKIDFPGLVINPRTVTTMIRTDGSFEIKTDDYNRQTDQHDITTVDDNGSRQALETLAQFIVQSNFFDVNSDAAGYCIVDIPYQRLEVTIGEKQNAVENIGSECDHALLAQTKEIVAKIETYVAQFQ
ncbi:MAG: hypothetical protein Q7R47_05525 [Candidatus Diapherotrites archaeon]|nr:hypothetical protein [Candidatus Diapherotrites archaeon]